MSLRKKLREFVADQITEPGEHKKAELAAAFLDENADLAREYIRELTETVGACAERLRQQPPEPDDARQVA